MVSSYGSIEHTVPMKQDSTYQKKLETSVGQEDPDEQQQLEDCMGFKYSHHSQYNFQHRRNSKAHWLPLTLQLGTHRH